MDRKTRDYMMGTFGTERHTKKMETSLESGWMEIILNNNHFPIPTPSSPVTNPIDLHRWTPIRTPNLEKAIGTEWMTADSSPALGIINYWYYWVQCKKMVQIGTDHPNWCGNWYGNLSITPQPGSWSSGQFSVITSQVIQVNEPFAWWTILIAQPIY